MCCLLGFAVLGQDSAHFQLVYDGLLDKQSYKRPADQVLLHVDSLIDQLHQDHYLEASVDSLSADQDPQLIYLHRGIQYQNIKITPNETAVEYAQGKLEARAYPYADALALKKALLRAADDSGYPFAEIKFQNIIIKDDLVSAEMHLHLHRKILVSDLKIIGDAKVHPSFLGAYLGLTPGKPLSKSQLKQVNRRLQNLPFVNSNKKPNVIFKEEGAEVFLFAKDKPASRFDALLGVLPVNDPLLDRSVILTATALIDLVNTLQRGERIFLEFRQLKPLTQDISTEVSLPYFAGLPFGVRGSFDLSKQDTSFLDVDYTVGAQYLYGGDNYIEIFYASDGSRILNVDEENVISTRQLPDRLDTQIQYYGLQWRYRNLDNILNPRSGWSLKSKFMIGAKQIRRSSLILDLMDPADMEFDFASLYEGLEKQDQLILTVDAERYFPLGKQSAFKIDLHGAGLFSEAVIFDNERFRVGGSQLLRGFTEQNFFTDRYLINTLEYRFTLTGNSVLFAFSDLGILQPDKSKKEYIHPWGIGAGVNFETTGGILSLSAAIGQDLSNANDFFDLSKPRIHVGYVNLF